MYIHVCVSVRRRHKQASLNETRQQKNALISLLFIHRQTDCSGDESIDRKNRHGRHSNANTDAHLRTKQPNYFVGCLPIAAQAQTTMHQKTKHVLLFLATARDRSVTITATTMQQKRLQQWPIERNEGDTRVCQHNRASSWVTSSRDHVGWLISWLSHAHVRDSRSSAENLTRKVWHFPTRPPNRPSIDRGHPSQTCKAAAPAISTLFITCLPQIASTQFCRTAADEQQSKARLRLCYDADELEVRHVQNVWRNMAILI